jgi:hypothetical protein
VYSGGYSVELLEEIVLSVEASIVSGIIQKYHMDKLVTGNKHMITYSGQGILFSSHSVEVGEYWCNLEYGIVLYGDSSKCGCYKIVRTILHKYHTDKLVTGNKHLVTYSCHVSLLSFQFV